MMKSETQKKIISLEPTHEPVRSYVYGENEHALVIERVGRAHHPPEQLKTNIILKKYSEIDYIFLLTDECTGNYVDERTIEAEEGAVLHSYSFYFGGAKISTDTAILISTRATVNHHVMFFSGDSQELVLHETFKLIQPEGFGRFIAKGIVSEQAHAGYIGNVKVFPKAQKTDSRLEVHSYIFGRQARCHMVPQLQIEANDVKAGHGATVSKINEDELFYLRSRGLNEKQAVQLFIEGIFLDATRDINSKEISQEIFEMAKRKYERLHS